MMIYTRYLVYNNKSTPLGHRGQKKKETKREDDGDSLLRNRGRIRTSVPELLSYNARSRTVRAQQDLRQSLPCIPCAAARGGFDSHHSRWYHCSGRCQGSPEKENTHFCALLMINRLKPKTAVDCIAETPPNTPGPGPRQRWRSPSAPRTSWCEPAAGGCPPPRRSGRSEAVGAPAIAAVPPTKPGKAQAECFFFFEGSEKRSTATINTVKKSQSNSFQV